MGEVQENTIHLYKPISSSFFSRINMHYGFMYPNFRIDIQMSDQSNKELKLKETTSYKMKRNLVRELRI